jgi:hypothetical protein
MLKIIIFLAYSFFKNLSSTKNSGFLEKGYSLVSINLTLHLLVIIKLVFKLESFESIGIKKSTIIFLIIIFSILLSFIFSFLTSRKFLNKCIFKYKKNNLVNSTGGVVFILYFLANSYISSFILAAEITVYSYLQFIILPLLFYIYCKMINRYNLNQSDSKVE